MSAFRPCSLGVNPRKGYFDSNPAHGLANPLYSILPRGVEAPFLGAAVDGREHRGGEFGRCEALADFEWVDILRTFECHSGRLTRRDLSTRWDGAPKELSEL